jgi:hypothetical protein
MATVTVTPKQAEYLAALLTQAKRAQTVYAEAVALLTLGYVAPDAVLTNIDTDTGVLTFTGAPDGD